MLVGLLDFRNSQVRINSLCPTFIFYSIFVASVALGNGARRAFDVCGNRSQGVSKCHSAWIVPSSSCTF